MTQMMQIFLDMLKAQLGYAHGASNACQLSPPRPPARTQVTHAGSAVIRSFLVSVKQVVCAGNLQSDAVTGACQCPPFTAPIGPGSSTCAPEARSSFAVGAVAAAVVGGIALACCAAAPAALWWAPPPPPPRSRPGVPQPPRRPTASPAGRAPSSPFGV